MLRGLLLLALGLAFVIVGASVTLRLSANGIGCQPWPACYGQTATAEAAQTTPLTKTLRLAHRITATAFVMVVVSLLALGWRRWSRRERVAGVLLLGDTLALAVIGLYTPSPLPLVTLVNLVGGFALIGLVAFLLGAQRPDEDDAPLRARGFVLLLMLLALQAAAGTMISARSAASACATECTQTWVVGAAPLWNPLAVGSAVEVTRQGQGGEPLHAVHRLGGVALGLVALGVALSSVGRLTFRRARLATFALAATLTFGFAQVNFDNVLWLPVLHALSAAALIAAVAILVERAIRSPRRHP